MTANTKIEWAHHTFNPWIGCTKVSEGCRNCYADAQDKHRKWTSEGWGAGKPRRRTSDANWREPLKWNRAAQEAGERHRVFCASLADVFDPEVPDEWRERLVMLIEQTPFLDWLLLTKRPEYVQSYLVWQGGSERSPYVLPSNVWIGTSVENQQAADERIPHLLQIPAAVRFLSIEPLLGPVTIRQHLMAGDDPGRCATCGRGHGFTRCPNYGGIATYRNDGNLRTCSTFQRKNFAIGWVIVGGESGHGARPMDVAWAESIVEQCKAAGVPVFVKQLGAHPCFRLSDEERRGNTAPSFHHSHGDLLCKKLNDRKGGDWNEWPASLRIRQFPSTEARTV